MITDDNPTGITDYDISPWARLPKWQDLSQLLNELVLDARRPAGNQDDLAEAVGHLARGIAYMDCCTECARWDEDTDQYIDTSAAPYATAIEDGWLYGRYRCRNGHEWTCGYAVDALWDVVERRA